MVVRKQYGGEKIRWWSVNKMAVRKQDGGLKTKLHCGNKMIVWNQDGVEHWLKKINLPLKKRATREKNGF